METEEPSAELLGGGLPADTSMAPTALRLPIFDLDSEREQTHLNIAEWNKLPKSLKLGGRDVAKLEAQTRNQSDSPVWFSAHRN